MKTPRLLSERTTHSAVVQHFGTPKTPIEHMRSIVKIATTIVIVGAFATVVLLSLSTYVVLTSGSPNAFVLVLGGLAGLATGVARLVKACALVISALQGHAVVFDDVPEEDDRRAA